ncbi:MAG: flagellar motor protein MotB [Pseudomonadota bacterium]
MAGKDTAPIIIKKIKKGGGDGHHGGAWKVAYADFVTAMMAFFLLMWLLNATTEKQRKGLADYFDPSIPLSRMSSGGNAMLNGDSVVVPQDKAGKQSDMMGRGSGTPDGEADSESDQDATGQANDMPVPGTADQMPEVDVMQHADNETPNAGNTAPEDRAEDLIAAALKAEEERLEVLARDIQAAISEAGGEAAEHFLLRMTPEGLVIEIVDTGTEPLFRSGSARPAPELVRLIEVITPVIRAVSNRVAVVGHTDASPFNAGGSDNWTLSSDRANAARRLLRGAGLPEARIARVSGRAATEPLSDDPNSPQNRRIALTLLRQVRR